MHEPTKTARHAASKLSSYVPSLHFGSHGASRQPDVSKWQRVAEVRDELRRLLYVWDQDLQVRAHACLLHSHLTDQRLLTSVLDRCSGTCQDKESNVNGLTTCVILASSMCLRARADPTAQLRMSV